MCTPVTKKSTIITTFNKQNHRNMKRTIPLTRSNNNLRLPLLLVRAPSVGCECIATHPGVSVGDASSPSTVVLPACSFWPRRLVQIADRFFLVMLSSLIGFSFLALGISSGRESKEVEGTVTVVNEEELLTVSGRRGAEMIHHISFVSHWTMMTSATDFTHTKRSSKTGPRTSWSCGSQRY